MQVLKGFGGYAYDGTESGDGRVNVDGKRIYVDTEECRNKFGEKRFTYLEKLNKRKQEAGGGEN